MAYNVTFERREMVLAIEALDRLAERLRKESRSRSSAGAKLANYREGLRERASEANALASDLRSRIVR